MKKILFGLCLVATLNMYGAGLNISKNEEVTTVDKIYHPSLNQQGDKLVYSEDDYRGLSMLDLNSGISTKISTENAAGYQAKFSNNGNVYYRTAKVIDRLRNTNLMEWNATSKVQKELVPMTRDNVVVVSCNGEVRLKSKKLSTLKSNETIAYTNDGSIVVESKGKQQLLQPIEGATSYLWVSISPDAKKILYVEPHKGIFVCNIDGSNNKFLGKGCNPIWMNNEYIALTKTSDDGYIILSSRLYAMNISTKNMVAISDSSIKVDDASASPAAKKLVYSSDEGKLFIVEY